MLERVFKFSENGTTLRRDTLAGLTTFIVMSYIIFVNPNILGFAGHPRPAEVRPALRRRPSPAPAWWPA